MRPIIILLLLFLEYNFPLSERTGIGSDELPYQSLIQSDSTRIVSPNEHTTAGCYQYSLWKYSH